MTIHIGLIGGGNITETHARAARAIPGVEIAAVFGMNAQKISRLCCEYGGTPYADFEKFLAHSPMDLVAIGSPSGLHAEQGIAAARRGLHVLTEKPIDITVDRADALIAEASKAGVKLGVFFQDRCKPDILCVKNAVDSGALGRPILADARVKWYRPPDYYAKSRWRGTWALDGGGALMNQAVHSVDLLLWFMGPAVEVSAYTSTLAHKRIEVEEAEKQEIPLRFDSPSQLVQVRLPFAQMFRRLVGPSGCGAACFDFKPAGHSDWRQCP